MRQFLEPEDSGTDSYVQVVVGEDQEGANLIVADCGRRVDLGFNVWQHRSMTRAEFTKLKNVKKRKLEKLRQALDEVEVALMGLEFDKEKYKP